MPIPFRDDFAKVVFFNLLRARLPLVDSKVVSVLKFRACFPVRAMGQSALSFFQARQEGGEPPPCRTGVQSPTAPPVGLIE